MSRYIDADRLIQRATNPYGDYWAATGESTADFVDYINEEPTAEVKPIVYGEWIIDKHNRVAQCSVCNKISPYDYGDFCKWCGATMRKESEEEE